MFVAPGVNPGNKEITQPFYPSLEREGPGVSSFEIISNKFETEFF
jgi:hypothetical protein